MRRSAKEAEAEARRKAEEAEEAEELQQVRRLPLPSYLRPLTLPTSALSPYLPPPCS